MLKFSLLVLCAAWLTVACAAIAADAAEPMKAFRPPAVPLVTHDPYFSVWSMSNDLTAEFPKHWTGRPMGFVSMIRVDNKAYRLMGPKPEAAEAAKQVSVEVRPTQTIYTFQAGPVDVTLTFTSPLLPTDLDLMSRPVTYIDWTLRSNDNAKHSAAIYLDATGEWAVDRASQDVEWSRLKVDGLNAAQIGSKDQHMLVRSGDDLRIDWGHLILAGPASDAKVAALFADEARTKFAADGTVAADDVKEMPRRADDNWPALVFTCSADVEATPIGKHALIAYDDEFSIQYMKQNLKPWWRRDGATAADILKAAEKDHDSVEERCKDFDRELTADLTAAGGAKYAKLASLAFRQCIAAHKLVASPDGKTPWLFSKENNSNGCIDTVDVTYPSSPFFLLFNPTLLKGQLTPVMEYAQAGRWKFPFAPHDLGQYPLANGQVYGGRERNEDNQMPVEESGNMIIMISALAHIEKNADFANKYWDTISKWADYLKTKGLDPERQLCTDDFAGHLAHNTNLSVKAIVALGGYAQLAETLGKKDVAETYRKAAKEMADKWMEMAADGDHYKLVFDKAGTWSQKYNLVWGPLLGIDLFPPEVAQKEIAYYLTKQNKYGLPLDNRKEYTKIDWLLWTATMATKPEDFTALVDRAYDYANETPTRVPLSDWYHTDSGKQSGFKARSVVGGLFIKLLADPKVWEKYAGKAKG